MLFIELALIRWLGANVLYLAYFSNVVLLGSFLGIGLGFLWTSRGRRSLFPFAPAALATLIVLVRAARGEGRASPAARSSSSASTRRDRRAG